MGNPANPLDPDGTVGDMGAHFFPQFAAAAVVRNGDGVNPVCYTSLVTPKIGSTWTGNVDTTMHGFAAGLAIVHAYLAPTPPILLSFGELLVLTTLPVVWSSTEVAIPGQTTHNLPVPPDPYLGGITLYSQAVVVGASNVGLCNALDLTLGI